jgi:quercetin dioxygenase-like cupin family protein
MEIVANAGSWTAPPAGEPNAYLEHLRVPDLSVGTYCIPAGGLDDQTPHTEDEIYVVTAGRARVVTPAGSADVAPGDVVFVPAGEDHRFVDIAEDLTLLVVFGPAYGSRARTGT